MGTWLDITVRAGNRTLALTAAEAAVRAVEAAEARLSTWRTDTELAGVNARGETTRLELSPQLARDLTMVIHWYRKTDGAFSPGVGALITAWDLRGPGRVPSDGELRSAHAATSMGGTEISGRILTVGNPGLRFEEGAFGKGAALKDALCSALDHGASCIVLDFGGQVAVGGTCDVMAIGVADPHTRGREVALLELGDGSAATSGLSERAVVVDGTRYGHIVDPRTGQPSADWGAVTVVAPDPLTADILATALYVMGPVQGPDWIRKSGAAEAVFAEWKNGHVELTVTPGLRGRVHSLEASIRYLPPHHRRTEESRE